MGEDMVKSFLQKQGHNPIPQVSTKIEGVTNRWDFFFQENGVNHFIEVKSGFNPRFTINQKINIQKISNGASYIFKGKNALKIPGVNLGTRVNTPSQVTLFRCWF